MGFCLVNNVAVAARHALSAGMHRIMIVDFDAHHGNGTQAAFLEDERVAFVSMHQWGIYPGTGWFEEGPAKRGRIVNVPLAAGAGDTTYAQAMTEIVRPVMESFRPEMLLVSAGFDGHWNDPITSLGLSTAGYFEISHKLVTAAGELCEGRIVFVLEGGYDPVNVANGAAAIFEALEGRSAAPITNDACPRPDPDHTERIGEVVAWHRLNTAVSSR
jgi:acetoin utilization deacetylase AcuC-like enzyme